MITKAEVYKMVIDMQTKSGQGCSGIVKLGNEPMVGPYLDELIEEGLIKACDTGGSIGHPESNIFYMPTKGYNVWEDEDPNQYSRHKGRNLSLVRLYLDILPEEQQNKFDLTRTVMLRDPEWMKKYTEWLEINKEELEIMVNLDNFYDEPNFELTQEEIDYIQTRGWYKDNKSIKECLKSSNGFISDRNEIISINNKLIGLYGQKNDEAEIKKCEKDIEKSEQEILDRKRINKWLMSQDGDSNIQDLLQQETV